MSNEPFSLPCTYLFAFSVGTPKKAGARVRVEGESSMAGDSEKASTSRDVQFLLASSCSSNKRRNTETPSSSSIEQSSLCLNDLEVELIEEILRRLPTSKSAFLCRCVCKNWYSLISTSCFAHGFISHHFDHQYKQHPYALIINYLSKLHISSLFLSKLNRSSAFTVSDEPILKSRGFELNYFPETNWSAKVLAVFNDLMLCSVNMPNLREVRNYICNPFTMDWVSLPLVELDKGIQSSQAGFVCEPYYAEDSEGECTINSKYRFRVVRFARVKTQEIVVRTYRSETQQWHRSVLEGSEYQWHSNVVGYNGKLLWYNGSQIFAYDPFNPELSAFADCSFYYGSWPCIGLCQGFLRFMQFTYSAHPCRKTLDIWELEDYTSQEWRLKHKVYLDALIYESSFVRQIVNDRKETLKTLSFHPSDGDIVYLHVHAFVILCNCRTRELKLVGEIPSNHPFWGPGNAFCIELPLWPTPIPTTD